MIKKVNKTHNIPLELFNIGNRKYFKKNEVFIHQGDINNYMYILVKGKVILYSEDENGSFYLGSILASPCVIADQHVISQKKMKYSFKCIEKSELIKINRDAIIEIMKADFDVNMFLYNLNTNNFFVLCDRVYEYSKISPERRVIQLFLELTEEFGIKVKDRIKINFKFTQQFISDLANIERSTTVRTIKKLKDKHILEYDDGYYYVNNMDLLKRMI